MQEFKKKKSECEHPNIYADVTMGQKSGDYICSDCGYLFCSRAEHREYREKLEKEKNRKD